MDYRVQKLKVELLTIAILLILKIIISRNPSHHLKLGMNPKRHDTYWTPS